jgi:hypothetical protein
MPIEEQLNANKGCATICDPAGVYAYSLEAVSIYGVQKKLNGNITLLR